MKCIDRDIGKYLSQYIEMKLPGAQRREFEMHLFECPYCWGQVQEADRDNEIDTVIHTFGREAFLEIKESFKHKFRKEGEQTSTGDPINEQIPTLWLMLNNAVMQEIKLRPKTPWTTKILKPGRYSVINQGKQVLYEMRKLPGTEKGISIRGKADSIARSRIEVIEIPIRGKKVKAELAIKLERKKEKLVLSLSVKVPKR